MSKEILNVVDAVSNEKGVDKETNSRPALPCGLNMTSLLTT